MTKLSPKEVAERFGYAEYMIRRYFILLGTREAVELLQANEKPLPSTIQTNTLQIRPGELKKRLEAKGFEVERIPFTESGLKILRTPFSVGTTTEYLLGYYTIQGAASMLVVQSLAPRPEERVIDMCAAPGMKTIQLVQKMGNRERILALDISTRRLRALQANVSRYGVKNGITM